MAQQVRALSLVVSMCLHLALQRDLLYTDGYISSMLGAREAASYFTRLLQFGEHHLQLYLTPVTMAFFIISPAVQHAPYTMYIFNRPAWLLDYRVRNYGTVVPQAIWAPATLADAQRYCNVLKMPIFFVFGDRTTLGIRLTEAAEGRCRGLLNGHAPAPVGDCHTIYIRVKVSVLSSCVAIVPIVPLSSGLAMTKRVGRL